MKWKLIGFLYFGLLNISASNTTEFRLIVSVITIGCILTFVYERFEFFDFDRVKQNNIENDLNCWRVE